jgi:CO/xanthine dehydrogenase Mo-binding subunit
LHAVGAEVHDLPLTPERILDAIATGVTPREGRRP